MVFHISFSGDTHGDSNWLVECLKGARLERSLECRRREERFLLLT
jgi:hypothetical protein